MSRSDEYLVRFNRVLQYNRCRIERALSIFTPEHRPLFHVLPFLLNVNHPEFPGFVDDPQLPFGLALYGFSEPEQEAVAWVFPEQLELINDKSSIFPIKRSIESLSLMGSIGTLAQSAKSDLDYWVCVENQVVNGAGWGLLQQKLHLIEQWAWQAHHLEVHFFLSDIEKVRRCDFGCADGESAGSAQPMFLKNEYYSTQIIVAGKIPFWWLAASDCTDEQYQQEYQQFKRGLKPNPKHVIDLGNVASLHANEMFGAMIWQLTKAMDSPFKSVLKMAKLEVFSHDTENRTPLCNILKARIHRGEDYSSDVRGTDPYTLMFDLIIDYYQQHHPKYLELFCACLYIKSGCMLSRKHNVLHKDLKREVIIEYLRSWQWSGKKIERYDSVDQWSFQQVSFLGKLIHRFLISSYRRVSEAIAGEQQLVTDEDMTVIGRKIGSFYGSKPGKIQYLKRAFETGLIQTEITIVMELDLNSRTKQRWSAFRGRVHLQDADPKNPCFLIDSCDPVELVVWCIFNRIISSESSFYLLQNKLALTIDDISELIEEVLLDFQPIRISDLPRELLLAPCQINLCLVVTNFASRSSVQDIEAIRIVYITSWGELYSFSGLKAFKQVIKASENQQQPPLCRLFTPSRNNRKILYRKFEALSEFTFDKVGWAPEPAPEVQAEQDEQAEQVEADGAGQEQAPTQASTQGPTKSS